MLQFNSPKSHYQTKIIQEDYHDNNNNDDGKFKGKIIRSEERSQYRSLANKVTQYQGSKPFFSVEFFPPRTPKGASTFVRLLDKYIEGCPYYCDVTWHVAGNPWSNLPTSSITIADIVLNYCLLDTMLHITCIGLTEQDLRICLDRAKRCGIRSILALRGDKDEKYKTTDFKYACDLVSFIRKEYGQYFTIVVAGYPIPHPESNGDQDYDIKNLKHKVDAGADFIITQMFFKSEDYFKFVQKCREVGIKVPIIPGICAINTYESLFRFTKLSSVPLPEELKEKLEPIKNNAEAVVEYGIHFLTELCLELLKSGLFPGIHFYTLNKDTIIKVIKNLGLWNKIEILELPWRKPAHYQRVGEFIRPVFWANRPNSYIHRTRHWEKFPTDNWSSNEHSTALNETLDGYYEFLDVQMDKNSEKLWQTTDLESIYQLFYQFYNSQFLKQLTSYVITFPWIQKLDKNFAAIAKELIEKYGSYIKKGLLVTNYLPRIMDDEDRKKFASNLDCQIYQKEYIEFYLHAKYWPIFESYVRCFPENLCFYVYGHGIENNWKFLYQKVENSCHFSKLKQIPLFTECISWIQTPQTLKPVYIADMKTFDIWSSESISLLTGLLIDDVEPSSSVTNEENSKSETKLEQKQKECPKKNYAINEIKNNFYLVSLIDSSTKTLNDNVETPSKFQKIFDEIFFKDQ